MIKFIVNFLAIIGVIIIITYIISYIYTYFKQKALQEYLKKINPPLDYMQNSGIKCPDYLSNNTTKNNKYFCTNRNFNIQINNDPKCLNNNNIVEFPEIPDGKTWETFPNSMNLAGYQHNMLGHFSSLKPAIYWKGIGKFDIEDFKFTTLPN